MGPYAGKQVVLATGNRGKVAEYAELLAPLGLEVLGLDRFPGFEMPEEDGDTFEANAAIKARAAARHTGMVALADDSGLEVDLLGGEPGIHSARYAGPGKSDLERCEFLLKKMEEALRGRGGAAGATLDRAAGFVCVIAVSSPEGEVRFTRGETRGIILEELRGHGGFGYDPLFYLPDLGKTYAELRPEEKNRLSHRARAAEGLPELLAGWPGLWPEG